MEDYLIDDSGVKLIDIPALHPFLKKYGIISTNNNYYCSLNEKQIARLIESKVKVGNKDE